MHGAEDPVLLRI